MVTPALTSTLRIRMLLGRFFDAHDDSASLPVAVINQALARSGFAGADPVNREITIQASPQGPRIVRRVVGVIADARLDQLEKPAPPTLYIPYAQLPRDDIAVIVRSESLAASAASIRETIRQLDPTLPVARLALLEDGIRSSLARQRLFAVLLTIFAAGAAALAAAGVFGVVSSAVESRRRELAIRAAMGASPTQLASAFLGGVLAMCAAGISIGVAGAEALSSLFQSLLYGVSPHDPWAGVAAALGMLVVVAVATMIPVRDAARVDPMAALRAGSRSAARHS
jgi:cell division protein FtsX